MVLVPRGYTTIHIGEKAYRITKTPHIYKDIGRQLDAFNLFMHSLKLEPFFKCGQTVPGMLDAKAVSEPKKAFT